MLNIFKCVKCNHELNLNDLEEKDIYVCPNCKYEFKQIDSIWNFLDIPTDCDVKQTVDAFGYQWNSVEFGHTDGSKRYGDELFFSRFGLLDESELETLIKDKVIYDPAIGSGRVEHIFAKFAKEIYATDISTAIYSAKNRWKDLKNINFFRADLLNPPFKSNSFDVVICHAILQHTENAFLGLKSLLNVVKPNGLIFFDLYRKASPIRDFGDDYIRNIVSDMPPNEAYEALKPITKLAQELYKHKIKVPEDIPYLEIQKGEYNLQRFVYYKLLKTFWNEAMSFEDNHAVTFDWFYPKIAKRFTSNEIKSWLKELNIEIIKYVEQEGGIGVVGRKKDV